MAQLPLTILGHHVRLSAGVTLPTVWGGESRVQQVVVTSRGASGEPCEGAARSSIASLRARNAQRVRANCASVRAEKRRTEKTRRAELRACRPMKDHAN